MTNSKADEFTNKYLNDLEIVNDCYREIFKSLDADYKATCDLIHKSQHEKREALLVKFRAELADYRKNEQEIALENKVVIRFYKEPMYC